MCEFKHWRNRLFFCAWVETISARIRAAYPACSSPSECAIKPLMQILPRFFLITFIYFKATAVKAIVPCPETKW